MQTAMETPGEYGSQYQGVSMAFEVVQANDGEDYYEVTLSIRRRRIGYTHPRGAFVVVEAIDWS